MKNQSLLAQSGSLLSDGGRCRLSSSSKPDALIPSRTALRPSQYANPQYSPNINPSSSSTLTSTPAISIISVSPVVAPEPTASACTPPVENSEPSGAAGGKDGQGVCTQCGANSADACNGNGCFYPENSSGIGQAAWDPVTPSSCAGSYADQAGTPSGYMLSFAADTEAEPWKRETELCLTAAGAAIMLRSLLGRGIASITVDVL